jgi:hypothetical protein
MDPLMGTNHFAIRADKVRCNRTIIGRIVPTLLADRYDEHKHFSVSGGRTPRTL